jgi:D-alanyl-lipoteichoic acid acyltransferase DltB (MBOAT superfamily)
MVSYQYRWMLLLLASYLFYASWNPAYLALIIGSTLVDYFCGLRMEQAKTKKQRFPFLILSLCINLGLLLTFKYLDFFFGSVNSLFASDSPLFNLLLPVGISFYTFQTLSYSIDVYKGRLRAERHLGYFALYVSFFPQLVAGPIERFSSLTPQFKKDHALSKTNLANGLRLIFLGFSSKWSSQIICLSL